MGASKYVTIKVTKITAETPKAFLVELEDPGEGDEEIWLPKTQIANAEDYEEGDIDLDLSITQWIADQKGVKYED